MRVFDLCCTAGHRFEGWFASESAFEDQCARALVQCPVCGDTAVARLPSAPRLNLSGAGPGPEPAPSAVAAPAEAVVANAPPEVQMQALWLQAMQHVIRHTVDVGPRFAQEARRIHYGEAPHRGIRGQATAEERAELANEGIEVMPLPLPPGLSGPTH